MPLVASTPPAARALQQIRVSALTPPVGSRLTSLGWVSSLVGLVLVLGGPALYYHVVFPRLAESWPDSLIPGAIGLGFMWLVTACAVLVVLAWSTRRG